MCYIYRRTGLQNFLQCITCCGARDIVLQLRPPTFDDGVVTGPVQENARGVLSTAVHLITLTIDRQTWQQINIGEYWIRSIQAEKTRKRGKHTRAFFDEHTSAWYTLTRTLQCHRK